MDATYDFGLVGLGVMGRNFILNVADNGFTACGLDLDPNQVQALEMEGNPEKVKGVTDTATFVASLKLPRKIMLLVPAGIIVDAVIESLLPHISKGDIIIDGGNSFFKDTDRREADLAEKGIHFFGSGISGGAKGARLGPSIMPGGDKEAYKFVQPIFEAVSAKAPDGAPCVAYLGNKSAGNYVKMVHNGIEYGLMQLLAEAYHLLKKVGGLNNQELHKTFTKWNEGRLQSFLVEITAEIFAKTDEESEGELVDAILDKAKQKGTGKWTSQNGMDLGVTVPTIDMAVSMRQLSALKDLRVAAEKVYSKPEISPYKTKVELIEDTEAALYFAFIMTYAQGFTQLSIASEEYKYELKMETIAKIWRGGCIIRAALLEDFSQAFIKDGELKHLIFDDKMKEYLNGALLATRKTVANGFMNGITVGALANSLTYFDALTSARLPLNLVQAQRDHFGSHTYERTDQEGIFHTEW